MSTHHRHVAIGNVDVFYREAGSTDKPLVLMLHGFPSSSHMYRNLIPELARNYRVIAPDLPGFGFTEAPARGSFAYSFENLADVVDEFVERLAMGPFALLVFGSGAPVGFRLACKHPERVRAIISHNGNAYEEGLSETWRPLKAYWDNPCDATRSGLKGLLKLGTTKWLYTHGSHDASLIAPEAYMLDQTMLDLPEIDEIQLDLMLDYASNIELYPTFQRYFREHKPPTLVLWSKNDPLYLVQGAEAFKRDNAGVELHLLDAGHFALESRGEEIGSHICSFLERTLVSPWFNRQ